MEMVQPLERLRVLETKIAQVIDLLHAEQEKTVKLVNENKLLTERLAAMEDSLARGTHSISELSQERARTKKTIDDLIDTIDQLVEGMPQPEGMSS